MIYSEDSCISCGSTESNFLLNARDHTVSGEIFAIKECLHCGFIYTHPIPHNLSKYYHSRDYISHTDKQSNLKEFLYQQVRRITMRSKLSLLRKYMVKVALPYILDYGAGTGAWVRFLNANNYKSEGYEPNEAAAQRAFEKYKLRFLHRIPEEPTFHAITLWHVFEHVHDLRGTIELLSKALKPDGILILALPNRNSWDAHHYKEYWAAYDVPRHLGHYTEKIVEHIFSQHDFALEKTCPMFFDAFYISLLSEQYKGTKPLIGYFNAFFKGIWSNLMSYQGRGTSSRIYVLRKLG